MSRYTRLQELLKSQKSFDEKYWLELRFAAQDFRKGFERFLEVPEVWHSSETGDLKPYVHFARVENESYVPIPFSVIEAVDGWLDFHIGVCLDHETGDAIYRRVQIRRDSFGYRVKSDTPVFDFKVSDSPEPDFDASYDLLFRSMQSELSQKP